MAQATAQINGPGNAQPHVHVNAPIHPHIQNNAEDQPEEPLDLEKLNAVRHLRAAEDRFESETRERKVRRAFEYGHRPEFQSKEDMETHLKRVRRHHDFDVSRVESRDGEDRGAVLVLRRKAGKEERACLGKRKRDGEEGVEAGDAVGPLAGSSRRTHALDVDNMLGNALYRLRETGDRLALSGG